MDIYQLLYDVINCISQEIMFLGQRLAGTVSKGITHWSANDGGQGGGGCEGGGGAGEGGGDPVVDKPPLSLVHVIL